MGSEWGVVRVILCVIYFVMYGMTVRWAMISLDMRVYCGMEYESEMSELTR